ncbi:MAG: ABC transporter ATP-binding protein [Tissierellales bacterium]|jgi:iron complex transport system ATP-binding protein|nr:ABC transporter ATP-binding protein [Tissierellales bacterium]
MLISIKELVVGYGEEKVINAFSMDVDRGNLVSIMGSNGSGKTTLIKTLARMLPKIEGHVELDGKNIESYSERDYAKKISLVLTERPQNNLCTVYDLVALGRYPHTSFLGNLDDKDHNIIRESLELVGAIELSERLFSELSDGEKQKVMIARALAQDTEIIIMDEPTIHLDIKHKIEVLTIIRRLCKKKNITVIASLHDIDLALKNSDYVLFVKDRAVIGYGTPEALVNEHAVDYIFDIEKATYNKTLGTLEWKTVLANEDMQDIFVIGGGGYAADIYRMLNKIGYSVITGVLNEEDIDAIIAKSIGFKVVEEELFMPISNNKLSEAMDLVKNAKVVIDTGVPFKGNYKKNEELLRAAVNQNKKIISFCQDRTILRKYANLELTNLDAFYKKLKDLY